MENNTNLYLQSDWEALYTGAEIQTFFVFAQFFTSFWCIMTYSSGMPILYPLGCFNYFVIYWVYKVLLIKFLKKSTSFNQDMPLNTINFYRIGVVLHMVVAIFVYTNSNILSKNNIE